MAITPAEVDLRSDPDLASVDEAIERFRARVRSAESFLADQAPALGEQIRSLLVGVEQRLVDQGFRTERDEPEVGQFFLVAREPAGEVDAVFRVCLDPAEETVRFGGKVAEDASIHLRRVSAMDFDRHVLAAAIAEWISASFGPRPIEDEHHPIGQAASSHQIRH